MIQRGRLALLAIVLLLPAAAAAQVRVNSPANKHNLSTTGPGPVKSTTMTEVCIFCHTPHNANPAAPLWNQALSAATYQVYASTTLDATIGPPGGSSKLCLSCHDGTIAIGNTINNGQLALSGLTGGKLGPTSTSNLGTNLKTSHPIAMVPVVGPENVRPPTTGAGSVVKLDATGQVQCVSCHEPHRMDIDPTTNKFLVMNNSASAMCLVCHTKTYWTSNPSTHKTSTKSYTATNGAHTGYTTVATNGCESCHKPHGALTPPRGLKRIDEHLVCEQCHGNAPNTIGRNIQAEFQKTYRHPSYDPTATVPSTHDASESPTSTAFPLPETSAAKVRHAACADCHNSHASYVATSTLGKGSGKIAGVWGIDTNNARVNPSGTPVSVMEYQICYKCHAGSANKPQTTDPLLPKRLTPQFNMMLMFDPATPSSHPIEAARSTLTGFSLKTGWTVNTVMYCTDCHDNDTGPKAATTPGTGPAGPHGSSIKRLLVGTYNSETDTRNAVLCYKCHDSTKVATSGSWGKNLHQDHHGGYSCSTCHDPHGVTGTATNNTHLINFDTRFVTPSNGVLRFDDQGTNKGRCYLVCHGQNHNPESY